ncbi:HNH endonuclease [Natronorubrum sp. JWXQ-INN-674]|uniref:HNH endonuclease n=1 Tax=Natronorubrum halalkaliphilum TaxID=2691917 RepID=A0A6B0VQ68_9EURY|nr:HNH endonuclease [Natronorubrum halalkaliphilum]MXV63648.1 HNH endonuclease [Natronorubrum halalkaliphilum]
MTSRHWQADRQAVFDRDERTCGHCDTAGDIDTTVTATATPSPTESTLHPYPIGDVPLEGTVHESALVTVCTPCFETLQTPSDASTATLETVDSGEELFRLVRETTRIQGGALSDIASFASAATSLPSTLADAGSESEPATAAASSDAAADYRRTRRDVLLAIDAVDAHLERLSTVEDGAFDADVRSALASFTETATQLQSTLRDVVSRCETVATVLERCHGCFDSLEGASCSTCGLEARETADWQRDDASPAFDRLFSSINDTLQSASTTTEALTGRARTLAERLTAV